MDMGGLTQSARTALLASGAVAVGFARTRRLTPAESAAFRRWLEAGNAAGMDWLYRHAALRDDPANVLAGVRTVASLAFSYEPQCRRTGSGRVSCYAWGDDYHEVIRRRLEPAVERLKAAAGGDWRICCDTAPLPERLWAMEAGIGRRGLNGQIIVDGYGSRVFLAEVLTTVELEPDTPSRLECSRCGACLHRCPGQAIGGCGQLDARRCLSYLTIEHRGEFTDSDLEVLDTPEGRDTLYGCDICTDVCPHNRGVPPSAIPEFALRPDVDTLTPESVLSMTQEEFSHVFRGSAVKRAKLAGLQRNALRCAARSKK